MSQENSIGLAELIEKVKSELLSKESGADGTEPLFSVEEVTLELQVTVRKEGNAGVKIYVIEAGGNVSRSDVQVVTVKLTPLLSKEDRIRVFKELHPNEWKAIEAASVKGSLKGASRQPLSDLYGAG
jgi:Trypsin-co-occurring domain 2